MELIYKIIFEVLQLDMNIQLTICFIVSLKLNLVLLCVVSVGVSSATAIDNTRMGRPSLY